MVSLDTFPQHIIRALQEIEPLIGSVGALPYVKDVVTMERRLRRSRNNLQAILPLFPGIIDSANDAAPEEGLPPIKPLSMHNQRALQKYSANTLTAERLAAQAAAEQKRPERRAFRALLAANADALEEGRPQLGPISQENREGIEAYGAAKAAEVRAAAVERARAIAAAEEAGRPERAAFLRAQGQNLPPPQMYVPRALGENVINPEALRVLNMRQQLARMTRNLGGEGALQQGLRRGGRRPTKRVRRNKTRGRR